MDEKQQASFLFDSTLWKSFKPTKLQIPVFLHFFHSLTSHGPYYNSAIQVSPESTEIGSYNSSSIKEIIPKAIVSPTHLPLCILRLHFSVSPVSTEEYTCIVAACCASQHGSTMRLWRIDLVRVIGWRLGTWMRIASRWLGRRKVRCGGGRFDRLFNYADLAYRGLRPHFFFLNRIDSLPYQFGNLSAIRLFAVCVCLLVL